MIDALEKKVTKYCLRFWKNSGLTEWPEFRKVARALRIKHSDLEEIVESSCELDLQGYNVANWKLGDLEIYVSNDETERLWAEYWAKPIELSRNP